MESEQVTPMVSIKDVVRSSVKVPEFNKHLKKAGGHIGRNTVEKNNKDEDNSPKTLNDKNQQVSSQKFRQLRGKVLLSKQKKCLLSLNINTHALARTLSLSLFWEGMR